MINPELNILVLHDKLDSAEAIKQAPPDLDTLAELEFCLYHPQSTWHGEYLPQDVSQGFLDLTAAGIEQDHPIYDAILEVNGHKTSRVHPQVETIRAIMTPEISSGLYASFCNAARARRRQISLETVFFSAVTELFGLLESD